MNQYHRTILSVLLASGLLLSGCAAPMKSMSEEMSITAAAPDSFEGEYGRAENESNYIKKEIEKHILLINPKIKVEKGHYAIGDLDGDGFPELALFIERDPADTLDEGALEIYRFVNQKANLIDKISMNYDNTNYSMKIGMISEDQNGLLMSNQVGAEAGITYGFILQDEKLVSILNPKKINLISVTANNSIDDINGDGILDFSIYSIDPETPLDDTKSADRILLWYDWDGNDGANIIEPDWKFKNSANFTLRSSIVEDQPQEIPIPGSYEFLTVFAEYAENHSKEDLSNLMLSHTEELENNSKYRSLDISALVSKRMSQSTAEELLILNKVSKEQLNNIDYISKFAVASSDADLKTLLLKNLNLGYLLTLRGDRLEYKTDYSRILSQYGQYLTNELKAYYKIISKESQAPHLIDGRLQIKKTDLALRLSEIEKFRLTFSYSNKLVEVLDLYEMYMISMLFNDYEGYALDPDSGEPTEGHVEEMLSISEAYPNSYFADVISKLTELLEKSTNKNLSDEDRQVILKMIP